MVREAALSSKQQLEAAKLYRGGLSAQQVANHFGVGIDAVFFTLRKLKEPRRSAKETNRIRFEAKPLSYNLKTKLSETEERLKEAAIMLYWAEGYKVGTHSIDFANSDPKMALIFRRFLSKICRVDEKRIRGHIYCYEGQDVAALTHYWSQLLSIPEKLFIKPYIKKAASPGPRGPRMLHGLVHIVYCDTKLLRQMLAWIEEYSQSLTK
ncbi:MAG: hypothetical protein NTV60_00235 [Candidatus Kaiserbacteria bacterium]|nr:hypothetical protein [Candidatus Kaiserbacteria bacterium]